MSRSSRVTNSDIWCLCGSITSEGDGCKTNGVLTIDLAILFFFPLETVRLTYQNPNERDRIDRTTPSDIDTIAPILSLCGDC